MFCPFCGNKIKYESNFCCYCGKEINKVIQPTDTITSIEKIQKSNLMQIIALLMMVLGNFLCIASNFIPIYCEQELGASYTYNMWEIIKYVDYGESGQGVIFKGIVVPLILATFFSGCFFVKLVREQKDIKIVRISKLSMICEIVYVALAYIFVDYVDLKMMNFQSFSNNGFILFAVAFLNLVYFHREYSKYFEKQDEKKLSEKVESSKQEEKKNNGLNIAIIVSAVLIVHIIVIILSNLQEQKTDEQDVVDWNIAGNYCTEHLAKENGLIDKSEHLCYGQYDEHIVTIYDITEESMHVNVYHSRIKQYCFDGIVEYDSDNGVRIEFPRYPGGKSDQWGTEVLYITPNYIYCTNKGEEAWGINIEEYFVKVDYSDLEDIQ